MIYTNSRNLPAPFVAAWKQDEYDRGPADISVTELIDPPRLVALRNEHRNEISRDVADLLMPLLGKAIHAFLEKHSPKNWIVEQRYFMKCGGWTVSGQLDAYDPDRASVGGETLYDMKLTNAAKVSDGRAPFEWEAQLNLLAHLMRVNTPFNPKRLVIHAMIRDHSRREALRDSRYPKHPQSDYEIPLWTPDKAWAYMRERVGLHQRARLPGNLPECTEAERWAKPECWAVTKAPGEKAIKLWKGPTGAADAEAHVTKLAFEGKKAYIVEHRRGESVRCESYCPAFLFCTQGQRLVEEAQ